MRYQAHSSSTDGKLMERSKREKECEVRSLSETEEEMNASRTAGGKERLTSSSPTTSKLLNGLSVSDHSTTVSNFPREMEAKSSSLELGIALKRHSRIWDRSGSGMEVGVSWRG